MLRVGKGLLTACYGSLISKALLNKNVKDNKQYNQSHSLILHNMNINIALITTKIIRITFFNITKIIVYANKQWL